MSTICLSDEPEFCQLMQAMSSDCCLSSIAQFVRIEANSASNSPPVLNAAVILHNYAMANLCLAPMVEVSKASKVRTTALRGFGMVQGILSAQLAVNQGTEEVQRIFFLALLSSRGMAQTIYAANGEGPGLQYCLSRLAHTVAAVKKLGWYQVGDTTDSPNAAAA